MSLERVLLTGATGFFGAHIAAALLRRGTERLICHVRGGGVDRVRRALTTYGIWRDEWAPRIAAVSGDLEQPELGLGSAFRRLSSEVDAVVHNGANVNYILDFKQLRAANVGATQDALRIAEAAGAAFFFVSTLRLFDHQLDARPIREYDAVELEQVRHSGYARSKAMAERLVQAAAARGVLTAIFRPGLLCGDGIVGALNQRDAVSLMLKGCVTLGAAPMEPIYINLTSVDYAAEGLAALAGGARGTGAVWHLVHDRATPMTRAFEALIAEGFPMELVPYDDWVGRLRDAAKRGGTSLAPLLEYFTPEFPETTTRRVFDAGVTRAELARHGLRHPEIDADYLAANVRGMIACGFLADPAPAHAKELQE